MSNSSPTIIKQAVAHFRKGDYQQAKICYQQAAREYGHELFAGSIRLCELRMSKPDASRPRQTATMAPSGKVHQARAAELADSGSDTARQLEHTQQLLEHYFNRCQELESQLTDRGAIR